MNKLLFDLYEGACEPFSLEYDSSLTAYFDFYPPKNGHILISDRTYSVVSGRCAAKLESLPDGSYKPYFYTADDMYSMPILTKEGKAIRFAQPSEDFIYKLAARCRFAARRIAQLEEKISSLSEKIEGSLLEIGEKTLEKTE